MDMMWILVIAIIVTTLVVNVAPHYRRRAQQTESYKEALDTATTLDEVDDVEAKYHASKQRTAEHAYRTGRITFAKWDPQKRDYVLWAGDGKPLDDESAGDGEGEGGGK